ncbi:MAG: MATE family efflux transporter [Acidobacteriaceae bacterium]|nr:MATE family efflux transporter [Acidobacteriaceae bacterium]MBV9778913.1 MATE family efflux transporter [Acidobacteriaceae bacterium]
MLKEALQGTHQDFTEGSLNRAIVLLAIPMILEMVMESLFGIVDVFFVSRLGSDAIATVGLTESLLTIVFGVAIGLSIATTAFVARRTGEKDTEGAADVSVQAIVLGLFVSAIVGIIGIATAPRLLKLMGGPQPVQANSRYTQLMLGGSAVIFLLFLINGIFRGAGDAALAMRTLWLANAINIVLDPCLINGWGPFPRLGVFGASVATTTGRGIGVLFQLWQLSNGRNRVIVRRRHVRLDISVMMRLLRVSATGIIQFLIATASWIGLVRVISTFGSPIVAGYTIAIRIIIFTILPAWGLSNAAATLVGQSLGAKKPHRAESSVYRTGFYNMLYLGLISIAFLLFSHALVSVFTSDLQVSTTAVSCLKIIALAYVSYAWGMVLMQGFNGAGDTTTPTLINFLAFWVVQLPIAYLLAIRFSLGPRGAFSAVPIADLVFTAAALILFRRGAWKRQTI